MYLCQKLQVLEVDQMFRSACTAPRDGRGGLLDKGLGAEQQQQQHLGYVKGLRMGQGRQRRYGCVWR